MRMKLNYREGLQTKRLLYADKRPSGDTRLVCDRFFLFLEQIPLPMEIMTINVDISYTKAVFQTLFCINFLKVII